MSAEVFRDNNSSTRPVDLSVFIRGNGYATLDRDRQFSASVPPHVYGTQKVPLGAVAGSSNEQLRADPDATTHPLATQVALRLLAENGEL